MALEPCVKALLCPLGNAVLGALKGILSAQIAFLQTQVAVISAQLIALEVQLIPIELARGLANTAIDAVRSAGNLVPLSVMSNCLGLGEMMVGLNNSLDAATAGANRILNEANRSLSFKAELEASVEEINATIDKLNELVAAIGECS